MSKLKARVEIYGENGVPVRMDGPILRTLRRTIKLLKEWDEQLDEFDKELDNKILDALGIKRRKKHEHDRAARRV